MFSGPSGTGKTMAAEVIARELGLDLYKIDLSAVVSKYIGETEKNLERIFDAARDGNAILFFDEADALFGKRSEVRDAHDRYANIEVSTCCSGWRATTASSILATNFERTSMRRSLRRIQFRIEFPFPDEADRRRIWQVRFPAPAPREADIDFDYLAANYRLAGGNITNVVLSAAFLAAAEQKPIAMAHLLHGVRREYEKMGQVPPAPISAPSRRIVCAARR